MATSAASSSLASQARRLYVEELVKGLAAVVNAAGNAARELPSKPSPNVGAQRQREMVNEFARASSAWHQGMVEALQRALLYGTSTSATSHGDLPRPGGKAAFDLFGPDEKLSLVDDATIDREILASRLALAISDRASWEFNDLRSRMSRLEGREELDPNDLLRAHVLARIVAEAWGAAELAGDVWKELTPVLHGELALLVEEAYHETNHWLMGKGVMPEVSLRPMIRRSRGAGTGGEGGTGRSGHGALAEETRQMTRVAALPGRGADQGEAVMGRLNKLINRHVPAFADTARGAPRSASAGLSQAIGQVQRQIQHRFAATGPQARGVPSTPALLEDLQQRKQALKEAAETPVERATIEIVALLFQSILTEDSIPASVRVWFARLQMPVLRVAVTEPDFFATTDHPARRLIDRMGSCVMGFDASTQAVGDALEKEIKRVVQVVEAYPDTGRRVFQTVLTEFEKFLEHYFRNENETTRKGVSLAQQVEQRETLAIQYTIELRKMLNEMPVQEGIRQFLFHVWADVLATTAVKHGVQSEAAKAMKGAAADLIWSASAKVSREERAEVIRRLPPLLKTLREGMQSAGMPQAKQDEHILGLNNSLAAAFTAKAAAIPNEYFEDLKERLETLEELLPEAMDVEIDESVVLDLSGHESSDLEVVGEGGSMPTPAMLAWARELQVGSWFMLDYRGRNEAVQLAWQGLRKQLTLFVAPAGRCVLFQQQRLAAFLQAGLLLPAQDEALTVRATRSALAKLDVDPARLLG